MPTEQYHEPPEELAEDVRTFARMCTSLIEEAVDAGNEDEANPVATPPATGGSLGIGGLKGRGR